MDIYKMLSLNILRKKFQRKNNRNRAVLNELIELGFSMPAIRKALIDLNELKVKNIVDGSDVSAVTISRTIKGKNFLGFMEARSLIAKSLNLEIRELFQK